MQDLQPEVWSALLQALSGVTVLSLGNSRVTNVNFSPFAVNVELLLLSLTAIPSDQFARLGGSMPRLQSLIVLFDEADPVTHLDAQTRAALTPPSSLLPHLE